MTDFADEAALLEQENLARALAQVPKQVGESLHHCCDCGEDIPENSRKLGGVTRCTPCQTVYEYKQQHYR